MITKSGADTANDKGVAVTFVKSSLNMMVIFLAMFVTGIMMTMAAVAGYNSGAAEIYQPLMAAIAVAICMLTHFILAISRTRIAWLLWIGCFLGSVNTELTFFSYENLRAGAVRAQNSIKVIGVEAEIAVVLKALNGIAARPVAVVADELAGALDWKKRKALNAELAEAKRAAELNDRIVLLTATATSAKIAGSNDPEIALLQEVTGNAANITLARNLGISILLELAGPWLWYQILSRPRNVTAGTKSQVASSNEPDSVTKLRAAIRSGKCKKSVREIRTYLRCSQKKASELRGIVEGDRMCEEPSPR